MTVSNYMHSIPPSQFGVAQGKLQGNMKPKYKTVTVNKSKKRKFPGFLSYK